MSQQIIFSGGEAVEVANVIGKDACYQGAQRDSLEIQIAKSAISFDTLDELTAESAKTDRMTIVAQVDDVQRQEIYDHYVIRTKLELRLVDIVSADGTPTGTAEDRYCVTLAQLTYTEVQQAVQGDRIAATEDAITALMFGEGV